MKYKFVLTIAIQFLWTLNLLSQQNADSLFRTAIEQSVRADYVNALLNAKRVLNAHPSRGDVVVFIANLYAWQKNFDSSKYYLLRAYSIDSHNKELYDSWLNVLLWNGEYEEILKTVNIALNNNYSDEYNILIKELIAFKYLGKYSEALTLCEDEKNRHHLDSVQVKNLYREILLLRRQNILTTYYSLDYLSRINPAAQHLASVDYSLRVKQSSLLLRLNYASRFNKNDLQVESEFYYVMKKSKYLYLNYGYAFNNILFPQHRAGLEYYYNLKHGFEASAGLRFLSFKDSHAGIITGSLSKYFKSFWIALRPYYSVNELGNSFTMLADFRKYEKLPLTYWNIELGFGNSPDERFIINQTENYLKLNSYRIKVDKNIVIGKANELKLALGYAYVESSADYYINRYIFEIVFRFRLE